jgi:hypothetical protein
MRHGEDAHDLRVRADTLLLEVDAGDADANPVSRPVHLGLERVRRRDRERDLGERSVRRLVRPAARATHPALARLDERLLLARRAPVRRDRRACGGRLTRCCPSRRRSRRRLRLGEFHGYALARAILEQEAARRLTAHGTLYKALGRMEASGLLASRWEDAGAAAAERRPRRRLYGVTGGGERALAAWNAASVGGGGAHRVPRLGLQAAGGMSAS